MRTAERSATPGLDVRGLSVFYGASHALQGVDLRLDKGVLSVVGRNGMGKTTLCKAIMGLVPVAAGSISFRGEPLLGRSPADIARMGVSYVPQGRRLWRSLTVDEHLRMVARKGGAWSLERVYATFPRLAERRGNGGAQLSGGEQQMLAISRALLMNPKLLVMDEPTEGLAPVIVAQVEEMLVALAEEGAMDVLVIEQNIGVACAVADTVAIMVNGRINRSIPAATLSGDRDLQQRLLGVGRHSHDETEGLPEGSAKPAQDRDGSRPAPPPAAASGSIRVYNANPVVPTRWSQPIPARVIEGQARTITRPTLATIDGHAVGNVVPLAKTQIGEPFVVVAGTLDTKGEELRFMRDIIAAQGVRTRLVDLSTGGRGNNGGDVSPQEVALASPRGSTGIASGDRGTAVAAMTEAFRAWTEKQPNILGMISAGGSGATALVTPAMQTLPVGVPKLMVSTMASGDVGAYVGSTDITMMYSVADVQGLNVITRTVLGNAAHAMAAMAKARRERDPSAARRPDRPLVGLTMFGVTTPCVQQVTKALASDWECLVFHATGTGGRSMEKLIESGMIAGVVDVSTTEVCDMMMGGILPATEDRFGAVIRTRMPYVGSVGALDMVNFGAPDTVPAHYRARNLYKHNPQITLMRTTPEENARMGRWIGERLNLMEGPVRFLLPEGGVSALDAPGQPFHDPAADTALFETLLATVRQTANRQIIRLPHHINDAAFAAALVAQFRALHAGRFRTRGAR